MLASLRAEGEKEKAKLLSDAQTLAAKIKEDAQFLADQEVRVARQKIREEMAGEAEARARELVQHHLSSTDQGRLSKISFNASDRLHDRKQFKSEIYQGAFSIGLRGGARRKDRPRA